ncbi:MAG: tRNA (adenosine(37)-N6)-threonylcarbamoyltransferase complex dimerization subunit type 1 TsaB [Armatimonadetes bacterium]|nr:tRNA (adenosine(37)-N6)-threonylcarbamoyltransferase complex dimerization subunit type 1 TsaB [Armatimonadota bacterium]MDE2205584.1 tRNA (adenosine(37)-N6)-threonylcarbamoyltransferase complex dimerization subunit type 1 TsaB [Armatimonadota bacterium]
MPAPKVLALETSGEICSVAVAVGASLQCEHTFSHRMTLSIRLMGVVDTVLECAGVELSDLDALACDVGPGSFTGVRIGVAAAASLSMATGLPVYAETALGTVAARLIGTGLSEVVAVVPHNRGAVSAQRFRNGVEAIGPPEAIAFTEFARYLGTQNDAVVLCGPGARSTLPHLHTGIRIAAEECPQAREIAIRAARRITGGESGLDPEELRPVYIAPPAISTPKAVVGPRQAPPPSA